MREGTKKNEIQIFIYLSKRNELDNNKSKEIAHIHLQTKKQIWERKEGRKHRLRSIDTHLALYTMLYNNSTKNRYSEPVLNITKQISKIRD